MILDIYRVLSKIKLDDNLINFIYNFRDPSFDNNYIEYYEKYDMNDVILFNFLFKICIIRDYSNFKKIDVHVDNIKSILNSDIVCSDSLFIVNINLCNDYVIYNGEKITRGDCILSKNEIKTLISDKQNIIKVSKKIFYSIAMEEEDYLDLIEDIYSSIENCSYNINAIVNNFMKNVKPSGRSFVADIIIRDYAQVIKNGINKFADKKIYFIKNNIIYYK